MKTSLFATPVFLSLLMLRLAQPTESPVEAILGELVPVPPRISATNPVQTRLSATIRPVGVASRASGELVFIPGGDQVRAIGEIRGGRPASPRGG